MNIKEAKDFIKQKLEESMNELQEAERIPVEVPSSINDYNLVHAFGALLVVYHNGKYTQVSSPGTVHQERDMAFLVVPVIRFTEDRMAPEEWIDFVADSLSGIELQVNRPEKKIYADNDEFIDEENGVWRYGVTVVVPEIFIEKEYRP